MKKLRRKVFFKALKEKQRLVLGNELTIISLKKLVNLPKPRTFFSITKKVVKRSSERNCIKRKVRENCRQILFRYNVSVLVIVRSDRITFTDLSAKLSTFLS